MFKRDSRSTYVRQFENTLHNLTTSHCLSDEYVQRMLNQWLSSVNAASKRRQIPESDRTTLVNLGTRAYCKVTARIIQARSS